MRTSSHRWPLFPLLATLVFVVSACSSAGAGESSDALVEERLAAFEEVPTHRTASPLVEAMLDSDDERWVPWLLDLHRVAVSNLTDDEVVEALATLTGVEAQGTRLADFQQYGEWSQTNDVDPGEGYREWKLLLYGRLDDAYGELLAEVEDTTELRDIHWGGVFRGGIPELNEPERVPVAAADWMIDEEVVLVAEVDGAVVAYPERIVARHELANDTLGSVPVAMVYCTLCRTGLLFDRRMGDEVLSFQTSGLLSDSNKIMIDNESETLWHHLTGTAFAGPRAGDVLAQFPLVTTTWGEFVAEHPTGETLVLPDPIFFPDIPDRPPIAYDYTPGTAYAHYYANDEPWFPIETPDGRLPEKAEVIGLSDGDDHLAVPVEALLERGTALTVEVGDTTFTLEPTGAGALVLDESGDQVTAPQSFWFAWYGRHPDTELWQP